MNLRKLAPFSFILIFGSTAMTLSACKWNSKKETVSTCNPSIASMAYNGGNLSISGNCLESISTISIENETDGQIFELIAQSKSQSTLVATLTSALQIKAGNVYRLLVSTAHGQTSIPFEITLGAGTVPLSALSTNGALGGQVLTFDSSSNSVIWQAPSPSNSNGSGLKMFKLYTNNTQVGEVKRPIEQFNHANPVFTSENTAYMYQTYSLLDSNTNTYVEYRKLFSGMFTKPASTINIDSLKALIQFEIVSRAQLYFSGPNCTGNLIVPNVKSPSQIYGTLIPILSSCNAASNGYGICDSISYKHLSSQGAYQSNVLYQSEITIDYGNLSAPNANNIFCYNTGSPIATAGVVYVNPSFTDYGAGDPPIELTNISFEQ